MKKIIAAIDGLKYSESTVQYALELVLKRLKTQQRNTLVVVYGQHD